MYKGYRSPNKCNVNSVAHLAGNDGVSLGRLLLHAVSHIVGFGTPTAMAKTRNSNVQAAPRSTPAGGVAGPGAGQRKREPLDKPGKKKRASKRGNPLFTCLSMLHISRDVLNKHGMMCVSCNRHER
jgi:hypothetical protein